MATRPNYLAAQAWGYRPKSIRRRRSALLAYLGPSIFYLFSIAGLYAITSRLFPLSIPVITRFVIAWLTGVLHCTLLPLMLENRYGNTRLLRTNYHDYRLAGISGREMLKGLAAPQLAGIQLFAWVYAITLGLLGFLGICNIADQMAGYIVMGAFSFAASVYNLLVGAHYYLAQWAICANKPTRILKTLALMFTCPITLCTFCPPLVFLFPIWFFLQIISILRRSMYAEGVWNRAQALLDGNDYEPPPPSTPAPTNIKPVEPSWRDPV